MMTNYNLCIAYGDHTRTFFSILKEMGKSE